MATKTAKKTITTVSQVVGEQVRALRTRRSLSQRQLAERVGMAHQQTLARLENGKRGVSVDDLFELAAGLDVAPVELLSATFEPTDVPVSGKTKLTPSDARQWIMGLKPLPGRDGTLYHQQTPAGTRGFTSGYPSLALARLALDDWEKAAASGDIDQEENAIRLLLDRARGGLRDLTGQRHQEYFTPARMKLRQQMGWED